MPKTDTIHTRVTHDIKTKAESLFKKLGFTTSQAVMLFLTACVNYNGFPFNFTLETKEDIDYEFAKAVATVDGVPPSEDAKSIFMLYKKGYIDLETAKFATKRLHQK